MSTLYTSDPQGKIQEAEYSLHSNLGSQAYSPIQLFEAMNLKELLYAHVIYTTYIPH